MYLVADGPKLCGFQMSLGFRHHTPTIKKLNRNTVYWNLKGFRRAFGWRLDGRCTLAVKRQVA